MPSPLSNALRLLAWYGRRPAFYPQLIFHAKTALLAPDNAYRGHQRALDWCRANAMPPDEAIRTITGAEPGTSLRDAFPQRLAHADRAFQARGLWKRCTADIDLLFRILANTSPRTSILETGVANGWSALAILLLLDRDDDPDARLVSVDMPMPTQTDPYFACVVPDDLRHHWTPIRLPDVTGVPRALRILHTIDLAHYDSDTGYLGRTRTYQRIWPRLRPGGILISDDVNDNAAFLDFANDLSLTPAVVHQPADSLKLEKYVGILKKPDRPTAPPTPHSASALSAWAFTL